MPFPAHSASRPERDSVVNPSRLLLGFLLLLIGAAWLAAWRLGESGGLVLHHRHSGVADSPALIAVLFIGGWITMTVAMMLPTSIPVITTFQTIARRRQDVGLLVALVIAGYLAIWSLVGAAVFIVQMLANRLIGMSAWPSQHAALSSSLILLLAGGYQFTQVPLSGQVSLAAQLRDRALARPAGALASVAARRGPRPVLCWLLLGTHAPPVRGRHRSPGLDAVARRDHGRGEEPLLGPPLECAAGVRAARLGSHAAA